MARPTYAYQAATMGGIFMGPSTMRAAREHVAYHRAQWPEIEVERVLFLGNNARRYWRWRSGRWTTDITSDPKPADLARWN